MKNIHLDLVRVSEAGALAAAEWVGSGNKEAADKAATEAMRHRLNQIDFCAEIAIGEGIKDKSFGLFEGELVGVKSIANINNPWDIPEKPKYSIAVDPIEGTTPTAKGGYEAMSTIAIARHGAFFKTSVHYMWKMAVGEQLASNPEIDIRCDINELLSLTSGALNKPLNRVSVCVLDRPRHAHLVEILRKKGVRIKLISDCDVTACIAACVPDSGVDMYLSSGGSPEAVLSAAAMKCMGGKLQTYLADKDGNKLDDRIFEIEDLAAGPVLFSATGITDGKLLKGVGYTSRGPVTHSLTMRSESGTIRRISTDHGN